MIETLYNFIWIIISISIFFSLAMIFGKAFNKKSINSIRKNGSFRELSAEEHTTFKLLYGFDPSETKVYSFNGQVTPVYFDHEKTKRVPDLIHVDGFPVTIPPKAINFAYQNQSSQIIFVIHKDQLYAVSVNGHSLQELHELLEEVKPDLVADRIELEILNQDRLITEDEANALKPKGSIWKYVLSFAPLCLGLYLGLSSEIVLPTVVFSALYVITLYLTLYSTPKRNSFKQAVTKAKGKIESIRLNGTHIKIGFEHFEQTVEFQAPIRWALAVNIGDIVEFETIQETREMLSLKNEWYRVYESSQSSDDERKQWGFMIGFLMLSIIAISTLNWSDIKLRLSLKDNKNVLVIDPTSKQIDERVQMGQYARLDGYRYCIVGENTHTRCEFFGFGSIQPTYHFDNISPGYLESLNAYNKLNLYPLMEEGEYQFLASMALASAGKKFYKYEIVDRKKNTYYDEYKLQKLAQFVEDYCLTEIDCDRAKKAIISIWQKDSSERCLKQKCWVDILNQNTDFGFVLMSKKEAEKILGDAIKKMHMTHKRQLFETYIDKVRGDSQIFVYLTSQERLYPSHIGATMKKWSGDVNSTLTSTDLNSLMENINLSSKIQTRGYITKIGEYQGSPVIHINTNIAESLKFTMLAALVLLMLFASTMSYHLFHLWSIRRACKMRRKKPDAHKVS
ncbi:hypothetical protein [Vibrio nigripulchritudo]|uniref:hypothetical protein n=1 Tax=Vibrio nigripulchritudo TaxID=28173 RepID=UPI0003B1C21E|nr:hypothetical protein [Vibrio nigripulchritudo]CCN69656.1 membrane hypothetical protein [Vibrio nigripulchritudo SFn118]